MGAFLLGLISPTAKQTASVAIISQVAAPTVRFSGGEFSEAQEWSTITPGTNVTIEAIDSIDINYLRRDFLGWYTAQFGGNLVSSSLAYTISNIAAGADLKYYAQYS